MHLFKDKIVPELETFDIAYHSDDNKDYDPEIQKDISDHDSEERGDINEFDDDDPC